MDLDDANRWRLSLERLRRCRIRRGGGGALLTSRLADIFLRNTLRRSLAQISCIMGPWRAARLSPDITDFNIGKRHFYSYYGPDVIKTVRLKA